MTPIILHVPMKPKAWERTRDYKGRRITDAKVRAAKQQVALVARTRMPCPALEGPLSVSMRFSYFGKTKDPGPHVGVPDIDNLAKLVMDACNGIVWKDDRQVSRLSLAKRWAEENSIHIVVEDDQ